MKKKALLFCVLIGFAALSYGQSVDIAERVTEVSAIIEQHAPALDKFRQELDVYKEELSDRTTVMKYHKGNKEVDEATNDAVDRIKEYHDQVYAKVQEYQSVWFDQTRNIIAIYTHYGNLKEASGGGATDLDDFVRKHEAYLDQLEAIKTDLGLIASECSVLRQ